MKGQEGLNQTNKQKKKYCPHSQKHALKEGLLVNLKIAAYVLQASGQDKLNWG